MSRIGNSPIQVPEGVVVNVTDSRVSVKGKLGELYQDYFDVSVHKEGDIITVKRDSEHKDIRSKHGLYRALINNMIIGVSKGFALQMELVGVGYRAVSQGQKLDLALGYSHNIVFEIPEEVKVEAVMEKGKNPIVKLSSHDKQLIGQVAAKIRSFRKPEPYKGKGIKFVNEVLRRKEGKRA